MRKLGNFTKAVKPAKPGKFISTAPSNGRIRKPPMTFRSAGANLKGSRLGKARKSY